MGWRARRSWRRTARRIVTEHIDEVRSRLGGFRGLPVSGVAATPAGTVRLTLPDWTVTMAGVAPCAQAALTAATRQPDCYFSDAGRYGRFWWVAVEADPAGSLRRTVVLGARLVLTAIEEGRGRAGEPGLSPVLMAS